MHRGGSEIDTSNGVLHQAALAGHELVVEKIINSLEPPKRELAILSPLGDASNNTVLHCAVTSGNLKLVQILLGHTTDKLTAVQKKNAQGQTVLHAAVKADHSEIVKLILNSIPENECVALINIGDNERRRCMQLNAYVTSAGMLRVLFQSHPEELLLVHALKAVTMYSAPKDSQYQPSVIDLLEMLINCRPEGERLAFITKNIPTRDPGWSVLVGAAARNGCEVLQFLLRYIPENQREEIILQKRLLPLAESVQTMSFLMGCVDQNKWLKAFLISFSDLDTSVETGFHCVASKRNQVPGLVAFLFSELARVDEEVKTILIHTHYDGTNIDVIVQQLRELVDKRAMKQNENRNPSSGSHDDPPAPECEYSPMRLAR